MRLPVLILVCAAQVFAQKVVQLVPNDEVTLRSAKAISVGTGELIYIADSGHHRVIAIDSTGKLVAESGSGGSTGAQMLWPVDVTAASGANVYVADAGNKRILKFSRLLEWQGEFEVLSSDGKALEPRLIAATPQGDIFVYESDEGQLLRYDPLFTLQNRLGAASGQDYLQTPVSITPSGAYGVLWIDLQGDVIHESDRFLSSERKSPSSLIGATHISALDSSYWLASDSALVKVSLTMESLRLSTRAIVGMDDSGDLVCASYGPSVLYVLDRRKGQLFRILFT